jgi:dipeptidyl aminopeptidase/acylaminoacyl peptidase
MESKDGQSTRLIFQDEKFPVLGLPDVSPDGTRMLFHRTSNDPKVGSQIVLSDLQGEVVTSLCTGTQPSWSADANQFVCARTVVEGNAGKQIWLMAADGRGGRSIGQGTSPRWSPDGKMIAFIRDNGIVIYDTVTEKSRVLVAREGHRYTSLGDAIAWEVNSKRLALLATRPNFTELVLVSVSRDSTESGQDEKAEDNGKEKEKIADVTLEPQRGFASCRSVGELSWGQDGIYFAIRPNVTRGVAKQTSLQLWVPALNGGVKVVPALSRDFAWKAVSVEESGKWYLAVSEH